MKNSNQERVSGKTWQKRVTKWNHVAEVRGVQRRGADRMNDSHYVLSFIFKIKGYKSTPWNRLGSFGSIKNLLWKVTADTRENALLFNSPPVSERSDKLQISYAWLASKDTLVTCVVRPRAGVNWELKCSLLSWCMVHIHVDRARNLTLDLFSSLSIYFVSYCIHYYFNTVYSFCCIEISRGGNWGL